MEGGSEMKWVFFAQGLLSKYAMLQGSSLQVAFEPCQTFQHQWKYARTPSIAVII